MFQGPTKSIGGWVYVSVCVSEGSSSRGVASGVAASAASMGEASRALIERDQKLHDLAEKTEDMNEVTMSC